MYSGGKSKEYGMLVLECDRQRGRWNGYTHTFMQTAQRTSCKLLFVYFPNCNCSFNLCKSKVFFTVCRGWKLHSLPLEAFVRWKKYLLLASPNEFERDTSSHGCTSDCGDLLWWFGSIHCKYAWSCTKVNQRVGFIRSRCLQFPAKHVSRRQAAFRAEWPLSSTEPHRYQ